MTTPATPHMHEPTHGRSARALAFLLALLLAMPAPFATAGLLGDTVSSFKVTADLSRRSSQENAVTQATSVITATFAADGSAFPDAPAFVAGTAQDPVPPAGGGFIPANIGAPLTDSHGAKLGYCVWHNGTSPMPAGGGRLVGSTTLVGAPVFAVVSAGLNGKFDRSCAQIAARDPTPSDDYVIKKSTIDVRFGVRGTLYFADPVPDKAALDLLITQPTAIKDGEMRLVKSNNAIWRWDTNVAAANKWVSVSNTYTASNVDITGGQINGTPIGNNTPSTGAFTTLNTPNATITGGTLNGTSIGATVASTGTFTRLAATGAFSATGNATFGGNVNAAGIVTAGSFAGNGAAMTNLNGSAITSGIVAPAFGGTGVNASAAPAGALLIGNGSGFTLGALAAGAGIGITSGPGSILIANTGVTSFNARTGMVVLTLADVNSVTTFGSNVTLGDGALPNSSSGNGNTGVGVSASASNTTGYANTALGRDALKANATGYYNTAIGESALFANTGSENAVLGRAALYNMTAGYSNTVAGNFAMFGNTTGSGNVAFGWNTGSANTTGGNNTLLGSNANVASGALNQATALGAGAIVSTSNTIVLGRTTDKTVIGATGDDGTAYNLQVTGGIRATSGGLRIAGGDLVLNSPTITGLLSARPAAGVAGRIYIATDTNQLYRDDGTTWNAFSAANVALSSITAATAANTINNGANAQAWNWQLAGNTTAFNIGENVASTGGTGAQYLHTIGTLAGSTAIPLSVSTRGAEAFRIDSASPQLVANTGTATAPSYSFNGNQNSGFYSPAANELGASVAGTRAMRITAAGSLALGAGSLLVGTSATTTAIGTQVLAANTTGDANTAMGFKSMSSNTTGGQNVALGYQSLFNNFSGGNNSAIGYNALFNNTSGIDNQAIGSAALFANTNGCGNQAIGVSALTSNTIGCYNQAIGSGALFLNTTGNYNAAIGFSALSSNTTGFQNIAIGPFALQNNIDGNKLVAIGTNALLNNTNGTRNVGIGNFTLVANTTGYDNVGLGANALGQVTTGASNVGVGRFAGVSIFGGNNNAFLGAGADAGSATLSYATALGSSANVRTSNTIVLGRTTDKTVIGATGDDGSAYNLQVTGGIKALSGGLRVAGGDLVLNSPTITGLLSARPAAGVAGRIYIATDTNQLYRDDSTSWNAFSAGNVALSSITAATAANIINNGANAQAWNWNLAANTTAFNIGENVASTGGTGTQYLARIGTLAGSTAIPLSVSTRGTEAFRVESTNPQIVANAGTAAAPSYAFNGSQSTGFYSPAANEVGATVNGVRAMRLSSGSVAVGRNTLAADPSANSTAVGVNALAANTTGSENTALGYNVLRSNTTGVANFGAGNRALENNTTGLFNTASGYHTLGGNTTGSNNAGFGFGTLESNTVGGGNTAVGTYALRANSTGNVNSAFGNGALSLNSTGYSNSAFGDNAFANNTNGSLNVTAGAYSLSSNTTGNYNAVVGAYALRSNTTGSDNLALGRYAGSADSAGTATNANTTGSNNTFIGNYARPGTTTQLNYATALGSDAQVSTANTIVLGRTTDKTVIGAMSDDASGYSLQVTGGIKASSGGLRVAGGDLVLNSPTITGLLSARPAAGVAGRIYIATDTNQLYRDDGTSWNAFSAGNVALSSLTAATTANSINNGANAQTWNWALTGNTTAFSIAENTASTGGTGTQYLQRIGTLAGSTAIPLSVSTRGTEAFRVDSTNPQIVANAGSAAAPSYAFNGNQSTGFYSPAANELGASVNGTRAMRITAAGSMALGTGSLLADTSATATAIGTNALRANTSGADNTAMGQSALYSNTTGTYNLALGNYAMYSTTTGGYNVALGRSALLSNITGTFNTALSPQALYSNKGSFNQAQGFSALYSNTTGNNNIAQGVNSLFLNSSGSDNVAIGSIAGYADSAREALINSSPQAPVNARS